MTPHASRLTCLLGIALSAFATYVCAAETKAAPADDMATACRQAKEQFVPLTEADLLKAKEQLREAVGKLEIRLDQDREGGQAWKSYLKWDEFAGLVRGDASPDLGKLDAVLVRLSRQHEGLELVWFVDVRAALARYLGVARAIGNPEVKAAYEKLLGALPARLDAYAKQPSPGEATMLGEAIAWLENMRQAAPLIAVIRAKFCQPNVFTQVSRGVVAAGMAAPVDDTAPVEDCILGTSVFGTGHTKGQLSVEFFPDEEDAVIDTILLSTTDSDTIGYNGPVRVYSSGVTRIGARKRFLINADGIKALPAVSQAETSTTFDGISAVRGGQFVERIAWKRAYRDKSLAESIAASHAEDRVNGRIDQKAEETLAKANDSFVKKFRQPLFERNLLPNPFLFSTTADTLRVTGLQAGLGQLAAASAPPSLAEPSDVVVRVHE